MSMGLLALLDDVAALVKASAASLDDIAAQTGAASSKAAGLIIDDAAVTPKYVVGLSPKRELPIIWNIAKGSVKNKILFLMPAALILGALLPWVISPILALGGGYLCFEGYEKLHHAVHKLRHKEQNLEKIKPKKIQTITPEQLEKRRTNSAIRTDFILSAEIIAISYAEVAQSPLVTQIIVLLAIAIGITAFVYGAVGLIVKADDVGIHLAQNSSSNALKSLGRGIVKAMPKFLKFLTIIGTTAMFWVGGGIIIHAIPFLHHAFEHFIHDIHIGGFAGWLIQASISAAFGVIIGAILVPIMSVGEKLYHKIKTPPKEGSV